MLFFYILYYIFIFFNLGMLRSEGYYCLFVNDKYLLELCFFLDIFIIFVKIFEDIFFIFGYIF